MKGHLEQCNVKSFNSISKHTNLPNRKKEFEANVWTGGDPVQAEQQEVSLRAKQAWRGAEVQVDTFVFVVVFSLSLSVVDTFVVVIIFSFFIA